MRQYIKRLNSILKHPANRNQKLKALSRSLWWQINTKLTKKTTEINAFGYKMLIYSPTVARRFVYYSPWADYDETSFIERFLRKGDKFIDIGANIGIYSLLAASLVGKQGCVDCFEPCPQTFNRLKENITRNNIRQVNLHALALAESSGFVKFTQDLDGTNHIILSDSNEHNFITVPSETLDETLSDSENYVMAKLDVEGVELSVLKGADNLLSKNNPPVLQLEINGLHQRYNYQSNELINFLKSKGYEMAVYHGLSNSLSFTDEAISDINNYLFIASKAKEWVKERLK